MTKNDAENQRVRIREVSYICRPNQNSTSMKYLTILFVSAGLLLASCSSDKKENASAENAAAPAAPSGNMEAKSVVIDTLLGKSFNNAISKLNEIPPKVAQQHKDEIERSRAYLTMMQSKFNDASFSMLEWRDQIYRIGERQKKGELSLVQASRAIDSLNALITNNSTGYESLRESIRQIEEQMSTWK